MESITNTSRKINKKEFDQFAFSERHRPAYVPQDWYQDYVKHNYHPFYSNKRESFLDDLRSIKSFSLVIPVGGQCVEVKRKLGAVPGKLGKRKGDIIRDYTRQCKSRFLKTMLSIDYEKNGIPLFYTLTYPGEYPRDPKVWKVDLDKFAHRMKYKFPDHAMIWKLEAQKRGAPHFCGMIFGCEWLKTTEGKEWFSRQWYETVASGDIRHLHAGTGIEAIKDLNRMINYVAKYAAKSEQKFDYAVGRYWGILNRKILNIQKEEISIDDKTAYQIKRVMKTCLKKKMKLNRHTKILDRGVFGMWMSWSNETISNVINNIERNMNEKEDINETG